MRRTYQRRSEVYPAEIEPSPALGGTSDELIARRERFAAAEAVLSELEEGLRGVLLRFELDEVPIAKIARELGIPLGTAKSRLRRGRTMLERLRARHMPSHDTTVDCARSNTLPNQTPSAAARAPTWGPLVFGAKLRR